MAESKTVFVVEDDVLIAEDLKSMCEGFGASVIGMAHTADEARKSISSIRPDYVLMDVRLGGRRDGVDIAKEVYDHGSGPKIIFITGSNEPPMIERIEGDHPYRILIKPISPGDLRDAIGL